MWMNAKETMIVIPMQPVPIRMVAVTVPAREDLRAMDWFAQMLMNVKVASTIVI